MELWPPKRPKKCLKINPGQRSTKAADEGNGTDDSDWEESSDEEKAAAKEKLVKRRHRPEGSKVVDDGDRASYVSRLEEWHEARTEEDLGLDSKYEALEGGLRVPARIWSRQA